MNTKKKKRVKPFNALIHCFFVLYSLICIVPFLLLISISFTDENTVRDGGYSLIPKLFSTEAYEYIFRDVSSLINAYGVTIFCAVVGTLVGIILMSLAGYVLARKIFICKKGVTAFFLITMIFHGGIIPSYIINTQVLHLNNNLLAYALIGVCSAYTIFIFRTFFLGLPDALIESAEIDGATEIQIFTRIVIPMSTPVYATMAFTNMLNHWNNVSVPLYYMTDSKLYNLQFLLQQILNEAKFLEQLAKTMSIEGVTTMPTETLKYAMCILATGPMMFAFPFFQKYFSKGMVVGSVKG